MFFKKKPVDRIITNPIPYQVSYAQQVYKNELHYADNQKFYGEYKHSIQHNETHNLTSPALKKEYMSLLKSYNKAFHSYNNEDSEITALGLYNAARNLDIFREIQGFQYLSFTNYLAHTQSNITIINFPESDENPVLPNIEVDEDDETEVVITFRV